MKLTATAIRVENHTDKALFVRFSTIAGNLRVEAFLTGQEHSVRILPMQYAEIPVTPDIRACYSGSDLSYEFKHHVPGGLMLQRPEKAERISDDRCAAVFRLFPVTN